MEPDRNGQVRELDLTPRQTEALSLVTSGMTAAQIGRQLGISPRTARAHIDALKAKLGVTRARDVPIAYRRATGKDPFALEVVGAVALELKAAS